VLLALADGKTRLANLEQLRALVGASPPSSGQAISDVLDAFLGNTTWRASGAPQTAAEIRDLLSSLSGQERLAATAIRDLPTGGGGVTTGDFSLSAGVVTARGEYIGASAPTISTPSTGVYLLTIPANTRIVSFTITGNNTTLNGSAEFVLQVNNNANDIQRSYTVAQYIANTGASANKFSLGTNETETFPAANVTQLLFPGMNGYGSSGFRLVLA
jgi:hypothetical protein